MFQVLLPDRVYRDIYCITPEQLYADGIRGLICDIDNTLVTYDDPEPTPSVLQWISDLRNFGIAVTFVSNNDRERVTRFNRNIGTYASGKSGKPLKSYHLRQAMAYMHTTPQTTAVIGDQIFTDIYAGKRIGLRCYLVKPIRDKLTPFFRFKRKMEIPVLRSYFRRHPEDKSNW